MRLTILPLLLSACAGGGDDSGKTGDDTGGGGDPFPTFVFVDQPWVGETSCFDGANWGLGQVVDPTCIGPITLTAEVEDFQTGNSVPTCDVTAWDTDDVSTSPSATATTDASGNFTIDLQSCSPFAYRSSTPPKWEETKDTYEVHKTYGWSASGTTSDTWNSVSESTSRLIPSLIGVEWDPATAVVAGTAYDCNQDGIANVQVFVHDGSGNIPVHTADYPFGIYYFSDSDLPTDNAAQPWTNENGLWVAINIPVGPWVVEMWGWDGTQHVKIGATTLDIVAGSVSISNIFTGIEDGIWYPDTCLAACG